MKEVSEFEARVLRILRCLMHRASVEQMLSLFVKPIQRPNCLSRNCVELVQDALSKGVTEWMARSAWTVNRSLHGDTISSGRLWERHAPEAMKLTFSRNSMELLIWLTAENFSEPTAPVGINTETMTVGDRLLMLMTFAAIRSTLGGPVLMQQPGFSGHGLIALLFPEAIGTIVKKPKSLELNLDFWCHPERCWILEALQSKLGQQWFRIERDKRRSSNDGDMRKIGELQTEVLNRLFDAAERHGRKDLCVFLLMTGRNLALTVPSEKWFDRLNVTSLRMTDRATVYRAALAFFHSIERLHKWTQQAQAIGFYDEDYRASQLWKSEWERFDGDAISHRARQIIERVDPVRAVAARD